MTDSSEDPLNILVLVLDACRSDYARNHASTLQSMAEENVRFENAIAPAPWSLPSHESMFSGKYPAEHGAHRATDPMTCQTAELLSEREYTTVGISANGFASQRTGFDESFDEFYYTGGRDPFADGLDVSGTAQSIMRSDGASHKDALWSILRSIPRHEHRLKSLANLLAVGCGEAALSIEALQKIPHPWFAAESGFCYDPRRNTERLFEVLDRDDGPYFAFVNYMDTHRPYKPNSERQRSHLGRTLSHRELRRINETVASPRKFLELVENGAVTEEELETVRGLYAGEVETVDEQLERIWGYLDRTGQAEDTLLVVTSDHGENLGETDEMGRKRMGHEGSVSDAVLSVPLVLAHPDLRPRRVEGHVSLKELHGLLLDHVSELLASGGDDLGTMSASDGPTWSHYPAVGGEYLFDKYPDAPEEAIAQRVSVDTVVGYDGEWKVVTASNGERWARADEGVVGYETVPVNLRSECEAHLDRLTENAGTEAGDLTEAEISQLETLGYM